MSTSDNSCNARYDFLGNLQKLLTKIDVNDEALIVRRAIDLQAFRVSLYYPRLSQLPASRKAHPPALDMIALARRHAALMLYNHYTAPGIYRRSLNIKGLPSWKSVQTGLSTNFKCIEVLLELLKDYLGIERGGLGALEKDISESEYADALRSQFSKSEAVATLIGAYRSNGEPDTGRRPFGVKIMRAALCDSKIFTQSEKTLDNYFGELEPTSVFHYLIWMQDCREFLRPTNPCSPKFTQNIMQGARSVDELRAVFLLYNAVVGELNEKYGFAFSIIENVPKPETKTDYDSLVRDDRNLKLAEHIHNVISCTA